MEKFSKQDQKLLASWAANCAERVLPFFEKESSDERPRKAIEKCREWVKTGVFRMAEIRKASLDAHKAAKEVKDEASFAAHAAGQAVATAHVPQHAFGTSYYVLKVAALKSNAAIRKEFKWQEKHLPEHLRKSFEEIRKKRFPKAINAAIEANK